MDVAGWTAERILAVPLTKPELLFSGPDSFASEHKLLAKFWHTDRNKDAQAGAVMAHINALKTEADRKAKATIWDFPGRLDLEFAKGDKAVLRYRRRMPFELGEMLYSASKLAFMIKRENVDLVMNGLYHISRLSFSGDKMADEMRKFLPLSNSVKDMADGGKFFMIDKTKDVFLLEDLRVALGGSIDAKHVGWILSSLYNLACYLRYMGISHNGISTTSVFVSPEFHSALLLGGWWYASANGDKLVAMPRSTMAVAPPDMISKKRADARADLACIKAIGRELLGDRTGMTLLSKGVPAPIATFLRLPSSGDAVKDYKAWTKVLEDSFGPRRFTELKINENDIYKLEQGA